MIALRIIAGIVGVQVLWVLFNFSPSRTEKTWIRALRSSILTWCVLGDFALLIFALAGHL